jgi:hypothetical protein
MQEVKKKAATAQMAMAAWFVIRRFIVLPSDN